jgi:hypothetical protein
MKFSQRIGKKPVAKQIQNDNIDNDLRIGIWNIINILVFPKLFEPNCRNKVKEQFTNNLWHNFYKLPIDTIPELDYQIKDFIREYFYRGEWYEIYDFIEFINETRLYHNFSEEFTSRINEILVREFSAYRLINGIISPITNEAEMSEIQTAIEITDDFKEFYGASIHLSDSLKKLSERKNPDYRNSIKESISAVENVCRVITGESTLGKALQNLERHEVKISGTILSGMEKLYSHTNSKDSGVRHAIIEEYNKPDFDYAKFYIVICSAFINLVIGKSTLSRKVCK